jgi:Ca2+-dependent lipid-binding protein
MGRIKYVLNERRLAYTQALEIQANSKVNSEVEAQKQVEREAFEKEAIEFVKRERRAEKSAEVKAASKVEKRKPAKAVPAKAKA